MPNFNGGLTKLALGESSEYLMNPMEKALVELLIHALYSVEPWVRDNKAQE